MLSNIHYEYVLAYSARSYNIYISIPIVILKISRRTYIQLNLIMIKVSSNIVGRSIGES